MNRIIENDQLQVVIADSGAELSSVYDKKNQEERIWSADPAVWNRHAPILFPFVGKVAGGVYRVGGQEYAMKTQHGFARDMEFACVEVTEQSVTHRLVSTENTRAIYPYEFELLVTHTLDANNPRLLHVNWEVKNNGGGTMYYSIGGHPGFTVPEGNKEPCYVVFPGKEKLSFVAVDSVTGLALANTPIPLPLEEGYVRANVTLLITWILDEQNIQTVQIALPDKTPYVTMDCSEFPMLGVWSKDHFRYICLEPWAGRTDNDGFTGTLEEKYGVQQLDAGMSKTWAQRIEFHG